jgi:23S rRNA (pseudouridine1915-N3)-methyltransferase
MFGKKNDQWIQIGIDDYKKRIKKYISFEAIEMKSGTKSRRTSEDQIKQEEGKVLLAGLKPGDHLILLDETGKQVTSKTFATYLDSKLNWIPSRLIFVIGGSFGFSDEVYKRANEKLAISKMTLPHQLARLLFLEQLYRAFSIINNHPYHHE